MKTHAVLLGLVAASALHGTPVIANWYFPRPVDAAKKNIDAGDITNFQIGVQTLGASFGRGSQVKDPVLREISIISIVPGKNETRVNTTDGENNPALMSDPQFGIPDHAVVQGKQGFDPKVRPGGAEFRRDKLVLTWDRANNPVEFGPGNRLRFGANIETANKVYRDEEVKLVEGFWTADGKQYDVLKFGVAAGPRNSYGVNLTNDESFPVLFMDLRFEYRSTPLTLAQLDPYATLGGIPMPTPDVILLNGIVDTLRSAYSMSPGGNLDLHFPIDLLGNWVTVQGTIYSDPESYVAFAYQFEVTPEPATWAVTAGIGAALAIIARRSRRSRRPLLRCAGRPESPSC